MSKESRTELAAQQAKLMIALSRQQPLPGFDDNRLKITAESLILKRERTVAKVRPDIELKLESEGRNFSNLFANYAKQQSFPSSGAHTDAAQFLAYIGEKDAIETPIRNNLVGKAETLWRTTLVFLSNARKLFISGQRAKQVPSKNIHLKLTDSDTNERI